MARFFVHDTFTTTDGGYALTGDILEGEINQGDFVAFKQQGEIVQMEILVLQMVGEEGTALVLSLQDKAKLELVDLKDKVIFIYPPDYFKGTKVKDILNDLMEMIEIG
jgi:hypothetical protein